MIMFMGGGGKEKRCEERMKRDCFGVSVGVESLSFSTLDCIMTRRPSHVLLQE